MKLEEQLRVYAEEKIKVQGIGHIVELKEIKAYLLDKYGTNPSSVIPADHCYNRVNNGISINSKTFFEYMGGGKYKILGPDYPYNGKIYAKHKDEPEMVVGECVNGTRVLY